MIARRHFAQISWFVAFSPSCPWLLTWWHSCELWQRCVPEQLWRCLPVVPIQSVSFPLTCVDRWLWLCRMREVDAGGYQQGVACLWVCLYMQCVHLWPAPYSWSSSSHWFLSRSELLTAHWMPPRACGIAATIWLYDCRCHWIWWPRLQFWLPAISPYNTRTWHVCGNGFKLVGLGTTRGSVDIINGADTSDVNCDLLESRNISLYTPNVTLF